MDDFLFDLSLTDPRHPLHVAHMEMALDEAERKAFLARYQNEVAGAYRTMPDGTVLLPFPRLFIVATR